MPVAFLVVTLLSLMSPPPDVPPADRLDAIRRAQVWIQTDVAAFDFTAGEGEFAPWSHRDLRSCREEIQRQDSEVRLCHHARRDPKVKYGDDNNEVYAGVAATRLLRALGFGADALYPVRVECRGCPAALGGVPAGPNISTFAVAALERKMKGKDLTSAGKEGWVWSELDLVDPSAGGAPRAQRDALKLLAVFLQHSDNKSEQQRLICLPAPADRPRRSATAPGDDGPRDHGSGAPPLR